MEYLLTNGSEVQFYNEPSQALTEEARIKITSDKSYKLYILVDISDMFDPEEEDSEEEEEKIETNEAESIK